MIFINKGEHPAQAEPNCSNADCKPFPYFKQYAAKLVDNGYSIIAVLPNSKKPRYRKWQTACFKDTDPRFLAHQESNYPADSVGIACGSKVIAIDIDADDMEMASELHKIACEELADTPLVRIGRFPRRALLYRPIGWIDTQRFAKLDVIGNGGCVVAFGNHEITGQPYYWIDGDPLDTPCEQLPEVTAAAIQRFVMRASALLGHASRDPAPAIAVNSNIDQKKSSSPKSRSSGVVIDQNGNVIDGREEFLTRLTFMIWSQGCWRNAEDLARQVWVAFNLDVELSRPKSGSNKRWSYRDALVKAKAICRKQPSGRKRWQGGHPASHLSSYRQSGYWTNERKARHQAEAARRTMTPSFLVVNNAMLDAVPLEAGQCLVTVKAIAELSGLAISTVKVARRGLIELGLWISERSVYVPIPLEYLQLSQADDRKEQDASRVQSDQYPLSVRVGSNRRGVAARRDLPDLPEPSHS
jgi:hypothetical protein